MPKPPEPTELQRARLCPGCGYDLAGLGAEGSRFIVCPECGIEAPLSVRPPITMRGAFLRMGAPTIIVTTILLLLLAMPPTRQPVVFLLFIAGTWALPITAIPLLVLVAAPPINTALLLREQRGPDQRPTSGVIGSAGAAINLALLVCVVAAVVSQLHG